MTDATGPRPKHPGFPYRISLTVGVLAIGLHLLFRGPWVFYGALVLTGFVGAATVLSVVFPARRDPLVLFIITLMAGSLAWLIRPGAAAMT